MSNPRSTGEQGAGRGPGLPSEFADAKLAIELIPKSMWGFNVRSEVSRQDWDRIRVPVYTAAGNRCEICGGQGTQHAVECHEVWEFIEEQHVQRLARLIALCPACHQVKHFGRAVVLGFEGDATAHLMKVNRWDLPTARRYISAAGREWQRRSEYEWTLDLAALSRYGARPEFGLAGAESICVNCRIALPKALIDAEGLCEDCR